MNKPILKKLSEKKGSMAILYVLLSFIAITTIAGFKDILQQTFVINEVQSIMDIAGTSALQTGVDQTKLRLEIFELNESYSRSYYYNNVHSLIKSGSIIKKFNMNLNDIDVSVFNSDWGLGTSSKNRPQATISAIAKIKVKSYKLFDIIPGVSQTFYNSRSNKNFTVTYNGTASDGYTELIIRSVTRIVYR